MQRGPKGNSNVVSARWHSEDSTLEEPLDFLHLITLRLRDRDLPNFLQIIKPRLVDLSRLSLGLCSIGCHPELTAFSMKTLDGHGNASGFFLH